ncbi:Asp-tRNA(Asn)/Glu-tRNA(Gln) amidotransferase subunit GatC [Polynucleobacter sp. Latsch14-2]|jgi:aspartyl-tRNA(Asn)/glutamyl-tRNA(Gln) amidotransferase subunit C|uniref:Asp-tRNA(Asn)/Glu-tRNA(Gln) amidotransferase subunit GatC n=1 Tax=Polynucleobacter sp. Latsch14-2 TaxID=2576920 RepID=UPI001C0C8B1C|nr:Asp-tRNA(Asn)/Glu-tRNA(Gln) amidotransferase subunit GatC [Polynucleobacter sp. Latsch14-2]MBU3613355.1 Asp-tRNA(Asn)/Glu-tRNA(Gln) amidotransferase subunit GatC [Polynucleobacter sp. Latsch14-2]
MKLDDVQRIAHLSKLELSQAEAEAVLPQLQAIFSLVEEMQAVDTTGLEPLAHPILFLRDLAQPLRVDQVTEFDRHTENMQSAPAQQDGYFLVPRVIE